MKIEIKFNKKFKKPEEVRRLIELTDITKVILDIIDTPTDIGRRIVNFKGEPELTIKFKEVN